MVSGAKTSDVQVKSVTSQFIAHFSDFPMQLLEVDLGRAELDRAFIASDANYVKKYIDCGDQARNISRSVIHSFVTAVSMWMDTSLEGQFYF